MHDAHTVTRVNVEEINTIDVAFSAFCFQVSDHRVALSGFVGFERRSTESTAQEQRPHVALPSFMSLPCSCH